MNFKPKWFILEELVPKAVFIARGERGWELLDSRALASLDSLRQTFGPVIVNDWHAGGRFQNSGLREWTAQDGAVWSQHKFGRAFDTKFKRATPREVFDYVLAFPDKFPFITVLENVNVTETYLHFDTRNHFRKGIWIVNP